MVMKDRSVTFPRFGSSGNHQWKLAEEDNAQKTKPCDGAPHHRYLYGLESRYWNAPRAHCERSDDSKTLKSSFAYLFTRSCGVAMNHVRVSPTDLQGLDSRACSGSDLT